MKWLKEVNADDSNSPKIQSFEEYMQKLERNPFKELRPTCLYLKEMFEYFGVDEEGGFNLFSDIHPDAPPVHGQIVAQRTIYQNLVNFTEEGFNNKFLLLVGPNGSSKSSLIKKVMLASEKYSKLDEGEMFSFSWIFPIDQYTKGSLGLGSKAKEGRTLDSYAFLEDKEISAILPSELKDHPILLIPLKTRQKIIEDYFEDHPERFDIIRKSYLYNGDLSQRNRLIFDALLKNYQGDYTEVYKHIRVERINIDRRYSRGATTIEPQLHVDAQMQQITMDRRLASLPPSLQSLNLFSLGGEAILANRGMLEFSDLLKRPLDTFKYLLMTMESRTINLRGILTELDIFFMGSSNEVHFNAFKQHPDFNSFRGRFNFIRVPYLLNYIEEKSIYEEQVSNIKDKTIFEPHTLEALCMWSTMTRMRSPEKSHFKDAKLGKIVEQLTPFEKCFFYAHKSVPDKLDSESKQLLKLSWEEVCTEYLFDEMYEGKFGISPREVKQVIYDLSANNRFLSFVELIEYLQNLITKKNEYDFLNIPAQGKYHHNSDFLKDIESHMLDVLDSEVRGSLGMVDDRSYEDYISKYILNVNALIKGEKIKNTVTGKFEQSDMYFIKEFENNINLNENPDKFRSSLIARLGAYALDNKGRKIDYIEVFNDLVQLLQESFRKEQKRILEKIGNNLVLYIAEKNDNKSTSMSKEIRDLVERVVTTMENKFKYSHNGAIALIEYLLKKRYDLHK